MEHNFRKLKIWEEAVSITVTAYKATKQMPKEEIFGMVSQMRRAANSMPSNIAEGCGRRTAKDFSYFIDISLGSSNELISDLIVCMKLDYLKPEEANNIIAKIETWQSMTFSFQRNNLKKN